MRRNFTGWLILLIVLLVATAVQALPAAERIQREFRSLAARYPSVEQAVLSIQIANIAAACASLYVGWILYRREQNTLRQLLIGLVVRCACVVAGSLAFPFLAGLPSNMTANLVRQATYSGISSLLFTGIWILYLTRSERVREIYGSQPGGPSAD